MCYIQFYHPVGSAIRSMQPCLKNRWRLSWGFMNFSSLTPGSRCDVSGENCGAVLCSTSTLHGGKNEKRFEQNTVTVTFFLLSVWRERQSQGHLTVFIVWWNVLIKGTENRLKLLEGHVSTIKRRRESALCQIQKIWLDMVLWWIFTPDNYSCDVPQNHGKVFTSWPCHWEAQTVINKTEHVQGLKLHLQARVSRWLHTQLTTLKWKNAFILKGGKTKPKLSSELSTNSNFIEVLHALNNTINNTKVKVAMLWGEQE